MVERRTECKMAKAPIKPHLSSFLTRVLPTLFKVEYFIKWGCLVTSIQKNILIFIKASHTRTHNKVKIGALLDGCIVHTSGNSAFLFSPIKILEYGLVHMYDVSGWPSVIDWSICWWLALFYGLVHMLVADPLLWTGPYVGGWPSVIDWSICWWLALWTGWSICWWLAPCYGLVHMLVAGPLLWTGPYVCGWPLVMDWSIWWWLTLCYRLVHMLVAGLLL